LSIVQGPFSVAPCQTLVSRFATFSSLCTSRACVAGEQEQEERVALGEGALPTPLWGAPVERFPLAVRMAAFATAGRRGLDRMEDRHVVCEALAGHSNVHLVGDAYSPLGDAKSSLGDAKSSLGDAKSSLGDVYILLGDVQSSLSDVYISLTLRAR
jgi:hypothetical protein